jgi:hypothetical protein
MFKRITITITFVSLLIILTGGTARANLLATRAFGDCVSPTVVVGSDGLARIAFSSNRTGQWQIYWGVYNQTGDAVIGPVQLTTSGTSSTAPRMDIDGQDRCFLIWMEGAGTSASQAFARVEADGSVGVAPTNFSLVTGTKKRADIATTADGVSHIVLEYYYATFFRIRYGVLDEDGGIVRSLLTSDVDIFGLDKYPSIDVDPGGIATMTWYDYAGFFSEGLYAAQYDAAGARLFGGQIVSGEDMYWTTILTPDGSSLWILYQQRVSGVDRVRMYQGGGVGSIVSPAPGPTRRPRVDGTPGNPVYAVWEDHSLGRSRIMAAEWSGGQQVDDALNISANTVDAVTPDIAANADGQYYVVWKAGSNIYYDSIRNYRLMVTAQVRAAHEDDPYITPPPPLPGVTVTMTAGDASYTAETNAQGVAHFAVAPDEPVSYEMVLAGSYYSIFTQQNASENLTPVSQVHTPDAGVTASVYLWEGGDALEEDPALQMAYTIQDFRRNYWEGRLGYDDWDLWNIDRNMDRTDIKTGIYSFHPILTGESGGASAGGEILWIMDYKCGEASTVRHELSHNLVADIVRRELDRKTVRVDGDDEEGEAIDEALADYFAASYANDPAIDHCNKTLVGFCVALRNIANPNIFEYPLEYPTCGFGYESHEGSVILSSALWNLRDALDGSGADQAPVTDALVLGAAQRMIADGPDNGTSFVFDDFYDAMIDEDLATGGSHQDAIAIALGDHNIGPDKEPHCPKSFAEGAGVTALIPETATQVRLTWNRVTDAASYTVKVKLQDWQNDGLFLADAYYPVATDLTDTTFVFEGRDPHTEYLFVVQPVDAAGTVGYRSEPAFLEALDLSAAPEPGDLPPAAVGGRILCNTPNPFNPRTTIHFEVRDPQKVRVEVYDLAGKRVRSLGAVPAVAGRNQVAWNGRDDAGRSMASGVYAVLITGRGWTDRSKVALLK